jgi:LysR family transcriptional activator of nhaA
MAWLNYHHLYYFWTIVREGGVSAASRKLHLAQPTVSGQLKELESSLGTQLFQRRGGKLVLTEAGSLVYRYAREIFALGQELQESLAGGVASHGGQLIVGIADVVPKAIAERLLQPALQSDPSLRVVCYEDRHERLLLELALYELDVVLTDTPVDAKSNVRAFSHLLGECGISLFAQAALAERLRRGFPQSLEKAAFLLPIEHTSLRRSLSRWFESHALHPHVRGEFQDSALLMALGQTGEGVFAGPSVIEREIMQQHQVAVVARLEEVRETFYAITVHRRIEHPAVRAMTESARTDMFGARDVPAPS